MKVVLLLFIFLFTLLVATAQEGTAEKFNEVGIDNCEMYLAAMDFAINEAGKDPTSTILVFVYEGKTPRYRYGKDGSPTVASYLLPQYGLADKKIASMRAYLRLRKVPFGRFEFVKAAFREQFNMEFWRVPAGAVSPKPTPTVQKMKYRKGKPTGFCLRCCE